MPEYIFIRLFPIDELLYYCNIIKVPITELGALKKKNICIIYEIASFLMEEMFG